MANPLLTLTRRPRRNRQSHAIRSLVQETHLFPSCLVAPLFVQEGEKLKTAVTSMPEVFRLSIDHLLKEVEELVQVGVSAINLFSYTPEHKKDATATEATRPGNLLQQAISAVKKNFPAVCVMADIALDPFTDHGHDGLVDEDGYIVNDSTLEVLCEMSLRAAEAGCDIVSPSDMMDGRVAAIRQVLDSQGFTQVGIMSYAAKYVSSFYGPFRDALDSAPKFGDKKSYQLNPANSREALLECQLDEQEGADMLLVKPAISNLDIIAKAREISCLPIGAYQVSGEWAMIKAAGERGWIKEDQVLLETLLCMRRAGADFILTYGAKKAAKLLG
ncbi:MAG: porphobilinogen synthase [Verrucomicrobia bacterium]|nr:porphobilinogen synthase [Verrucomicrobiota bacterium]